MRRASSEPEAVAQGRSKVDSRVERTDDRAYILGMTLHFDAAASPPDPLAAALARKSAAGGPGAFSDTAVAAGDGFWVYDIVCTCGPRDPTAEEQTSTSGLALVLSGSFVARGRHGTSLLGPGSLFLVEAGRCFACSHQHGEGDRCLSFKFEPELFERIAHDAGAKAEFAHNSLPPLRELSRHTARARMAMTRHDLMEEAAFEMLGAVVQLAGRPRRAGSAPIHHHGRMTEVLRYMAAHAAAPHKIAGLARMAHLSPYHFLRSFKVATGVTPHQWLLRTRLRNAAEKLAGTNAPVTDIALDVGFEDLSNFTRSFRVEFGASPREFRLAA
jgi:AraC family transcriptional regulator